MYDAVVLLDCKLSCTAGAFGELCNHLEHLGNKLSIPTKGMLFSSSEFWLYEQRKGIPLRFMKGNWDDMGSFTAISSFFEDVLGLYRDISLLCKFAGMHEMDPQIDGSCASGFLGQGAFGRAIRVLPMDTIATGSDNPAAMKFVVQTDENFTKLSNEFIRLRDHQNSCTCDLVVTVTSDFLTTERLCGFIMCPVGYQTCSRNLIETKRIN